MSCSRTFFYLIPATLGLFAAHGATPAHAASPDIVTCPTAIPSTPDNQCRVTPGTGKSLILRAKTVLAPDKIYQNGNVEVDENGIITYVGCKVPTPTAQTTQIDCPSSVLSPGLINPHDHVPFNQMTPDTSQWGDIRYDYRLEWIFGTPTKPAIPYTESQPNQVPWSELRQVMSGTTSISGITGSPGFLRNLDTQDLQEWNVSPVPTQQTVDYNIFPLGFGEQYQQAENCTKFEFFEGWQTVFETYSTLEPHVAEGINAKAHNELLCLNGIGEGAHDLTTHQSTFIHTVAGTVDTAQALKDKGTPVVWSPRSNLSLYGNTAPVTLYKTLGLKIALGTDWTATGSMNMLREMRCAMEFGNRNLNGFFTSYELWKMATQNGADALNVDDKTGRLKVGKYADIAIYQDIMGAPFDSILYGNPNTTQLVLRGGTPLYGDQATVRKMDPTCDVLPPSIATNKAACTQSQINMSFEKLAGYNKTSYALNFGADTPFNEPTCTPYRKGEYNGKRTIADPDGDGIPNAKTPVDNCPYIFNPIRPMDNGKQPDADNDGIGDLCDPTPAG